MEKADPPSPTPSHSNSNKPSASADDVLHSQLQQLIQHNTSAPPADVHSQISSNPHSRYSSPAPTQQQMAMPMYEHGSPYTSALPAPTYSAGYQQQGYQMEPSPYPQLPDTGTTMTPHNAYSTPATSPPTPLHTDGMTTRSGRAIRTHGGSTPGLGPQSSRVEKASPKPRSPKSRGAAGGAGAKKTKKRKGRGAGDENPVVLEAPLSVLVKHLTTVQDTNIEEYVNRSPETRQQEVRDSKEGKIKRPMNAFMLYRKAYQNRTKEWKKHDNHQVISQVCGTSWNMEGQELRDQYDTWAKIERANHKLAFPDYKFAPAKTTKNRKVGAGSRSTGVNSEEDGSDLEGYEWDISAPTSRAASRAARPIYDPDAEYRPPGLRSTYGQYPHQPQAVHHTRLPYPTHPSSFHYSNPGKPRPAEYGAGLGHNQYYQQTSEYARPSYQQHHMSYGAPMGSSRVPSFVENVYMNKANSPANSFHSSPVDHYGEMMGSAYAPPPPQQPQVAMPHQRVSDHHHHHHQIDPSLMGPQGGNQFDTLGIMGLGDHNDGMAHYSLDQGALGGHIAGDDRHGNSASHAGHPQFEQAFHNPPTEGGGAEHPWHDDPMAALHDASKLDGEWEALAPPGDFQIENIDELLGTTESPGG
ncbi:hypothetical protein GGR54DRAFT_641606 [Hypoxylon sp. NC1633]|nr:hypothetical protein GGR54DRAFT_641606 [Hypoxylon sp. NC1633]